MHNNNYYRHKKNKKINRVKELNKQEIINYRTLNI